MGEVLEIPGAGGAKRYDPNAHVLHDHLVCTDCGQLWDVFRDSDAPSLAASDKHGFEVTSVEIVFRGLCPACQLRRAGTGSDLSPLPAPVAASSPESCGASPP